MRQLLYGHSDEVANWVGDRVPHAPKFEKYQAIGVVSFGKLVAGVVYHDYQPDFRTIQLSMAADSPVWARKEIIRDLLAYPFVQLGCFKVWTMTPIDNVKALKVNEHIGIVKPVVLSHMFGPGRHAVIRSMLKPDFERRYG